MNLFFKELGEGEPLIVLHGLFGSSDNWFTLSKRFADTHKTYLLDLRNHGNSFHHEDFSYPVMAEDVIRFIKEKDLKNPTILGHSMGGKVAMTIALNNPEIVKNLIIADISPATYSKRHDKVVEALSSLDLTSIKTRQQADQHLSQFIPQPGERQFLLKNLDRNKEGGFSWKINLEVIERNIDKVGDGMDSSLTYPKPTLFIKGGKSPYINDNDLPLIKKLFPASTIQTIEESGHWVHAQYPEEFYNIVMDFLLPSVNEI